MIRTSLIAALASLATIGFAQTYPSEFEAQRKPTFTTGGNVLIRNGRVLTITRGFLDGADVLIQNGHIVAVGKNLSAPAGIKVVDATGKFVTPGLVDAHSHRGADDINESDSISAEVRMADVLNADQPSLYFALASGITTGMLLHGSANPIGGQSIVIKHKWRHPTADLPFPGAPRMIKFALGENVKESGGQDTDPRFPATRMGVEAVYRRAFADAKDYIARWDNYRQHRSDPRIAPPRRDLRLEALAEILQGKIRVQCHSYRQDEMLMMVRLSQEYHFNLTMQHALEGYKIAPELAAAHVPVSIFGDGFAYKLEVIDSAPVASTILDKAGVLVSINTDTEGGNVPLTQDAAKAIRYGTSPERALRMITINPAIQLGVDGKVGSIEVGKDGDMAIWDGHPMSNYTKCVMTFIEGEPYFERRDAFGVNHRSLSTQTLEFKPFSVDTPLPPAGKSYLISGATVHPISGPVQLNSTVLIENGKIAAVGAKVEVTAGTVRVDGRGLHVYPGMIDAGSQLGLIEIGQVPSATDERENGDYAPDLRGANAVNPESIHFPKVRYNGITSAVVYPSAGIVSGQSGLVSTLGTTVEGMRIEGSVGLDVNVPAGLPARFRSFFPPDEIEKRESGIKERRQQLKSYFEAAKRYDEAKSANEPIATDVKLEALRPFVQGKRPVMFHAGTEDTIRWAVATAKALKLKAVIVGGEEAWKLSKTLRDSDIPVIAVPPAGECPESDEPSNEFDPYDTPMAFASVLADTGVRFAFASQGWETAMNLPYRVGRMCAFGLSHDAAMRALTLDAAKILGVDDRYGSLQPGKVANVIVTDGDPLEVTTHLRYLFIDGKPVALESHYTDLYRKYMSRVR
ncbi:amidohydrolase family protein [Fimbriimonas ginsengisoli]|uniref:Amidohydrolase containing protein n=1 Tax=Fimbriimonas ginsengisoli Gsoil 348 TaxID=661478 RepID=A0A068NNG8_FIMGI|nr:amidohydrolase family protein [Fimbriimonas ginsengisoli]AIE84952.1 amidohydrolase containing protein [Fimbriimonas ginsengisoli Gsoil 348]